MGEQRYRRVAGLDTGQSAFRIEPAWHVPLIGPPTQSTFSCKSPSPPKTLQSPELHTHVTPWPSATQPQAQPQVRLSLESSLARSEHVALNRRSLGDSPPLGRWHCG